MFCNEYIRTVQAKECVKMKHYVDNPFRIFQAFIDQEWEQEVLSQLHNDYQQQACRLNAFTRVRGIRHVGDLLRGLLPMFCALSPCAT